MKVLLTNDDGIRAPGIVALWEALADPDASRGGPIGDVVWPVAPLTVQSATSHGVTFHEPLMVEEVRIHAASQSLTGIAVDGRPADCVKLAICSLWPERFGPGSRPDLVISGMNAGANIGINVIYSGTVAAAIEAAFLGVPSIAVSLHLGKTKPDFAAAARRARRVIDMILKAGLGPHECVSINIPRTEEGADNTRMPPVRVCSMNVHGLIDQYEKRTSPSGDAYYWPSGSGFDFRTADPGSDVVHLLARDITVTPLRFDLTAHDQADRWRAALES
jgi:5'-nucleotidase